MNNEVLVEMITVAKENSNTIFNAEPVIASLSKEALQPQCGFIRDLIRCGEPFLPTYTEYGESFRDFFNQPPEVDDEEHDQYIKLNGYKNHRFFKSIAFNAFYIHLNDDDYENALSKMQECLPGFMFTATEHYFITQPDCGTTFVFNLYHNGDSEQFLYLYGLIMHTLVHTKEAKMVIDEVGNINFEHQYIAWMTEIHYIKPVVLNYDSELMEVYEVIEQKVTPLHEPVMVEKNNYYNELLNSFYRENSEEIEKRKSLHLIHCLKESSLLLDDKAIYDAVDQYKKYEKSHIILPEWKLKSKEGEFTYLDIIKDIGRYNGVAILNPFYPIDGEYDTFISCDLISNIYCTFYNNYRRIRYEFLLTPKAFIAQLVTDKFKVYGNHQEFQRMLKKLDGKMSVDDISRVILELPNYATDQRVRALHRRFYEDNELECNGSILLQSKANFVRLLDLLGYKGYFDRVKKVEGFFYKHDPLMKQQLIRSNLEKDLEFLGFTDKKLITQYIKEIVDENVDSGFFLRRCAHVPQTNGYEQFKHFVSAFAIDPEFYLESFEHLMELTLISMVAAADGAIHSPRKDKLICHEGITTFFGPGDLYKSKWLVRMFKDLGESDHCLSEAKPDIREEARNKADNFTFLVVEMSEIDEITTNPKLEGPLKRFLSRTADVLYTTGPYKGRSFERSTVFVGSTNKSVYLHDTNTRRIRNVDLNNIDDIIIQEVDFKSLFKYIADKYLGGAKWWIGNDPEDEKLKEVIYRSNLKHHKDGKYMLLANELVNIVSQSEDDLVSMNSKKIYIALTGKEPDTVEVKRFAEALKDKEVLRYNERDSMFKVSSAIKKMYEENSLKLVKSA
ncbi:MAG: VapE family protein [Candidatus Pacebacteria bacterium]|nr:VapE family protein [Candidatus Paceibacterota bacterium]